MRVVHLISSLLALAPSARSSADGATSIRESAPPAGCSAAPRSTSASALLARARAVTGYDALRGHVLRASVVDTYQDDYEADRPYPPYHALAFTRELWFDPASGIARVSEHVTGTTGGPGKGVERLESEHASWSVRDGAATPSADAMAGAIVARPLDVFAMLHDWSAASDVRVVGECTYRDYLRVVLARRGMLGEERLFLDPESAFPVKLDRDEPHYLWGRQHVEYLYVTWYESGAFPTPMSTVRLTDGEIHVQRALGRIALVPRDSAPSLDVPDAAARLEPVTPLFLQPLAPDTVRVDSTLVLLRNRGYTEAITLVGDTVYLLDATQGEARSRADSAWIARLFPGRHPVALVVTDFAWPHVAGVRFWVAHGSRVFAHPITRGLLERVVARRWTEEPDLLERRRAASPPHLESVATARTLARGRIQLVPIDGIGSAGALLVYLPEHRFVWASDYVQNLSAPTLYVSEVVAAAKRAGLHPTTVGAQHIRPAPWSTLEALAARRPALGSGEPATSSDQRPDE